MDLRPLDAPFLMGPERACAMHLQAIASQVMSNWVMRVANLPVFRADPGLDLVRLRGRIGVLVPAIVTSLVVNDPLLDDEPGQLVETIAADHGRLRNDLGISIGILLVEFHELRRLLCAAVETWGAEHEDAGAPRVLTDRLMATLDRAQVAAAEAWTAASSDPVRARAS